jgi:voltage-gated potassium channel Kch
MARGTVALIAGLFAISALIVVSVSLVLVLSGALEGDEANQGDDPIRLIWLGFLHTLDSGAIGGDVGGLPFLLGMLLVTFGGIFIASTLIGVITSGIEGKLDDLRKGRSRVLESGHTVVLGWSTEIFDVISELVLANANQRRRHIIVLAERDKVEMEEAIRQRVPDTLTTRVICRSGSPIELADLAIASLHSSRAIVVLSPESDDPDTEVIKTLLAITNDPDRRQEPYRIVAELIELRNVGVAGLASRGEAQVVLGGDLIGRIAAQACRQPGLSIVYQDLLDFGGDEMYFWSSPELVGRQFGECLAMFRTSSLIGIAPAEGEPQVNPSMDTVIADGDRLVFVSMDDDKILREDPPAETPNEDAIVLGRLSQPLPESTLVLGWNARTAALISELDNYVASGSHLTVVADHHGGSVAEQVANVRKRLRNQELTFTAADTTDRDVLDGLVANTYEHIVVMSYSDVLDVQRADARTLVTLLHLRDIQGRNGLAYTIVSEMLDVRNRALAAVTSADDFIVSGKLVSLMMSQLAENPDLRPIFDDIFDDEGSEICLKRAGDYVVLDEPVDFYTVVESARRRGQTAFGYRLVRDAQDPRKNYGVAINPDKAMPVTFAEADRIILLSAD